jgi:c-di-GMP-binding flagellar brake protein YcgR
MLFKRGPGARSERSSTTVETSTREPVAPNGGWNARRKDWVRVEIRWHGSYQRLGPDAGGWAPCKSIDLSAGGAAIVCRGDRLAVGDEVLLRFDTHSQLGIERSMIQLRAVVRNRRRDTRTYGVAWTHLTPAQENQLIRCVLEFERESLRRAAGNASRSARFRTG